MEVLEKETNVVQGPVSFTQDAIHEIKNLLEKENVSENVALRVGVKGGGCSGMSYILGFDSRQEGDEEFIIDGIRVFMNKSHELYVFGMTIDYQKGLNARGFVFQNPNAKTTCGCGTSFSA
jgi:iron-sulfur cluster assembly protein